MEGTIIILFCCCLLSICMFCSAARDTIAVNESISDGQTIVSARGEFEMGFFSPAGNPQYRYFGIWYKKISNGTVIWVANREVPIFDTSGVVRVSSRGILVSINQSTNIRIWSSYSESVDYPVESVKNPVAQLLDTGNLVFRDESENQNIMWQSFDEPVNNLLPGMKLGVLDFLTWKNDENPSSGNFNYRVENNGFPQLIMRSDSYILYRTGPWVGSRFSGLPVLKPNGIYTERFVMTETEAYYVFDLVNTSESSAITRLTLTPDGEAVQLIWNREKQEWAAYRSSQVNDCDRYGVCGMNGFCNINNSPRCECIEGFNPKIPENWAATDWSDGCSRNVQLKCGNEDGFMKYSGVKLPDTQLSWYNMSMNLAECKDKCLKDCTCTAYSNTDIRNGGSGCLLWFGDLNDMRGYSDDGQDLFVRMPASELKENRKLWVKKHLQIVLIPVLVILTVMISLLLFYAYRTKNKSGKSKTLAAQDLDLPIFGFMQIANATDNFSNNRQLGKGGFGTVYKGILEDGQEIAVKRLSQDSRQGIDEFMNEVSCIAKLQHRNLVMLLGCCIEKGEMLLIYEYLPNKSLDVYIFDRNMCQSLNWPKRYNIVVGIARGLLYLHQDSRLRIIHRDLKASTTRMVGTRGYMSPEYASDGLFSVKSDVYSFGVSLLEIIAGKRNNGFHHPDHNLNLTGHVWKRYNECNLLEVVDSVIVESSNQHEVFRVIQIGLLCVQEYPEDRPNMSSVIMMLTRDDALPIPKQPGFFLERTYQPEIVASEKFSTLNTISVSSFAPR